MAKTKPSLWQLLKWTHQLWIRLPYSDRGFCIGRLPMYSGEPIGIWSGYVGPTVDRSRFAPKRTPMKEWAFAFQVPRLWVRLAPRWTPPVPHTNTRVVDVARGVRMPSDTLDYNDEFIARWNELHGQRPAE